MAAVRLARALAPSMQKRGGGVILHNASICAKQPLGYEPIYNVTKAALMMFSKCLSDELIGQNIRVNCINPGLVLTRDWIKTAKELTAGQRHHLAAAPRQDRQRQCAHRTFRLARRGRRSVRLPLLGAIELLHRLHVLHRWRLAEERGVTATHPKRAASHALPPPRTAGALGRPVLEKWLDRATKRGAAWVEGAAGTGKTWLVALWLKRDATPCDLVPSGSARRRSRGSLSPPRGRGEHASRRACPSKLHPGL